MDTNKHNKIQYRSSIAIPPGETLLEVLESFKMSQTELAQRIGRPLKLINEIVRGKAAIMPETAIQLEQAFGIPATFWINLESNYQELSARLKTESRLESQLEIAKLYPYSEMAKWGWVQQEKRPIERARQLLNFFGVSSLENIIENQQLQPILYRRSGKKHYSWPAIAAWLRKGVVDGLKVETAEYQDKALISTIDDLLKLTVEIDANIFLDKIRNKLAECGVAFVVTQNLENAPINGTSRWINPNKALIQLSFRHKYGDIFWFTLFHEIGHVLTSKKRALNVDFTNNGANEQEEEGANQFARTKLIPPNLYKNFISKSDFSAPQVAHFARSIGIHPGIAVGRLQHDGFLLPNQCNRLRTRYEWKDD